MGKIFSKPKMPDTSAADERAEKAEADADAARRKNEKRQEANKARQGGRSLLKFQGDSNVQKKKLLGE